MPLVLNAPEGVRASNVQRVSEEDDNTTARSTANEALPRGLESGSPSRDVLSDSRAPLADNSKSASVSPSPTSSPIDDVLTSNSGDSSGPNTAGPISTQVNNHTMTTRAKSGIHKPKFPYIGFLHSSADSVSPTVEPTSVVDALNAPHWKEAMQAEFSALQQNKTWILVPSHCAHSLVDCKCVFKTKYKADGSLLKYKARLVAKGFQQSPGLDYGETFSPVVKPTTIRVVLTIVVTYGWEVRQLDVDNAFLNGNLQETVYMKQPEGFIDPKKPHHVCKLCQSSLWTKTSPKGLVRSLACHTVELGFC